MSQETLNTVALVGTFIVIAATAIAALIQLRHLRSSNQIAALTEFRETMESDHYIAARRRVGEIVRELSDANARKQVLAEGPPLPAEYLSAISIGNLYDNIGTFVRYGMIYPNIACRMWTRSARYVWRQMEPLTAFLRRIYGPEPALWEDFEYFVVRIEDFIARHPVSTYPRGVRRLKLDDPWL